MHAKKHHPRFLREKRPDTVETPAGLVGMDHQRVSQQGAEYVELVLPVPGQLPEQSIRRRFVQPQILQELQGQTYLVERQTHDLNEVCDLDDDFQAEFAAAEYAGN